MIKSQSDTKNDEFEARWYSGDRIRPGKIDPWLVVCGIGFVLMFIAVIGGIASGMGLWPF